MVDMVRVEKYREELGVPKSVIANKCGVTVNTYDNWRNKPDTISAKNAKALAEALKITEPATLLAIFFAPNVHENVNNQQ